MTNGQRPTVPFSLRCASALRPSPSVFSPVWAVRSFNESFRLLLINLLARGGPSGVRGMDSHSGSASAEKRKEGDRILCRLDDEAKAAEELATRERHQCVADTQGYHKHSFFRISVKSITIKNR